MGTPNTNDEGDLLTYVHNYLALSPQERKMMESTQALRELSLGQMAAVLGAFYED